MNGIDWSKAPEWADRHGCVGVMKWPVWFNDEKYQYVGGQSFAFGGLCTFEKSEIENITFRSSKTWNGEGLPPVGTVCEWKDKTGFQWVKATVLFITESSIVMQREDGFEWQMMTERTVFRPFRTIEQIAAEVRADKIESALRLVNETTKVPGDVVRQNILRHAVEAMIDAGYHQ